MRQYLDMMDHILKEGVEKNNRTGIDTIGIFGYQSKFDLSKGYPLLTTKKINFNAVAHELIWFLSGSTNIKYLVDNNVNIWNEWPYQKYLKANKLENDYPIYSDKWKQKMKDYINNIKNDEKFAEEWGDLGPVYGKQWRNFNGVDQIKNVLEMIEKNPDSRRMMVSAWNPSEVNEMALPPCHCLFQFSVENEKLSCQLYQRSCDAFLGVPFNIASYSLLTMMTAHATDLKPGNFIHTYGDLHIYKNHIDQVKTQLSREPRDLPTLKINPEKKDLFDFKIEDFVLENYDPHPPIKAEVAV